ncbi:MAG: ASPIC/UnbV domain-containing protein [Planctomycetota bacterium]
MASSCGTTPETDSFTAESVGNDAFVGRHNAQIFADGRSFSGNERDKLFLNDGSGDFVDVSAMSGADSSNDGRAVLAFDADDDGDLDLFVHETQRERHALYRNDAADGARGVKLRLRATTGNAEAIGATVVVDSPTGRVAQVLSRGAGFLSCQAPELVFGLGDAQAGTATVLWPGGARETFAGLAAGGRYLLVEGAGAPATFEAVPRTLPDPTGRGLRVRVGERVGRVVVQGADGAPETIDCAGLADGERIYLNLWASYCGPCVAELPMLEGWDGRKGTRIAAVSVDAPSARERAGELLGELAPGLALRFVTDEAPEGGGGLDELVDLARLPLPTTIVIGPGGAVESIVQGALNEDTHAPR